MLLSCGKRLCQSRGRVSSGDGDVGGRGQAGARCVALAHTQWVAHGRSSAACVACIEDLSDESEELASHSDLPAGSKLVIAVVQESSSFTELAESDGAATLAEFQRIAAQLPALMDPYTPARLEPPLNPHAEAILAIGTSLLMASGLIMQQSIESRTASPRTRAPPAIRTFSTRTRFPR